MTTHETVLKNEAIDLLAIKPDGIYVDGTLGGGGHAQAILAKLDKGFLYAFDRDQYAIRQASETLRSFSNKTIIQSNFKDIKHHLQTQGVTKIDGLLLDLGLSSFQIDDADRGFTYLQDTRLDMRMDDRQTLTAADIVNTWSKEELARIFFSYGEERNSFKIADQIIKHRPLQSTAALVAITDRINKDVKGHSAKRVFQALRIAVNDELSALEMVLADAVDLLKPGGRLVVITFHSLEDRIVKHFFKAESEHHIPKNLPIIHLPKTRLSVITRKPIYPSEFELQHNPRSRSAKLRAAERNEP
ncbi:MAG: 16S rRNA (cytosine(1402)-N(4))-methyltransferase RsmH [Acholeplasmataceae bacterium]|nr:MAG: 16S rRNA (cytosine(1402)-N(4))-methyltransferase RsmH [Acholeplasmataceae bacterium]